jgi:hypothetical protein
MPQGGTGQLSSSTLANALMSLNFRRCARGRGRIASNDFKDARTRFQRRVSRCVIGATFHLHMACQGFARRRVAGKSGRMSAPAAAAIDLSGRQVRARVRGATFEQDDGMDADWLRLPRGTQVRRFVRRHKVKHWLAIDDERVGFEGCESCLVHCQVGVGLGDTDVQRLFARRLELMFGPPDCLSYVGASTPKGPR